MENYPYSLDGGNVAWIVGPMCERRKIRIFCFILYHAKIMPYDHLSFFTRMCITLYGQKNVSLENQDKGLEKVLKKSGILLANKSKNPVYFCWITGGLAYSSTSIQISRWTSIQQKISLFLLFTNPGIECVQCILCLF